MRTFHKDWGAAIATADPTDRTNGAIRKTVCEQCLNVSYAVGVFDRTQRDVDRCAFCGSTRLFPLRGLTRPRVGQRDSRPPTPGHRSRPGALPYL